MNFKPIRQGVVLLIVVLFTELGFCVPLTPTGQVKKSTDEILVVVMEKGLDKKERLDKIRQKIREIVADRFDFRSMSQSVLSTHWRTANAYERDRFVEFFTLSLEDTYTNILDAYDGEEITYLAENRRGDRATVDTLIVSGDRKIPVTYKLKLNDDKWFAYDVVIEHSSLVSTYRNLYANIVKSQGVSGLLDQMKIDLKNSGK